MTDELKPVQSAFFTIFGIIIIFICICVGMKIAQPEQLKDKDCIIYNHEIYCKEREGK